MPTTLVIGPVERRHQELGRGAERARVAEQRRDVAEHHPGLREVGDVADEGPELVGVHGPTLATPGQRDPSEAASAEASDAAGSRVADARQGELTCTISSSATER